MEIVKWGKQNGDFRPISSYFLETTQIDRDVAV